MYRIRGLNIVGRRTRLRKDQQCSLTTGATLWAAFAADQGVETQLWRGKNFLWRPSMARLDGTST